MARRTPSLALVGLAVLALGGVAGASFVPDDGEAITRDFERRAASIRAEAEARIEPLREEAVRRLQILQDRACQAGDLDGALAIRARIHALRGVLPDPGTLGVTPADIGRVMLYETTGRTDGAVWGTESYTSDSDLGTAAVHAGLLLTGQRGVVRVTVVAGQSRYAASTRHGVTTHAWGAWNAGFTLGP